MTWTQLRYTLATFLRLFRSVDMMKLDTSNNVVVITGGCGGLGKCLAQRMVDKGVVKVVVLDVVLPEDKDRLANVYYYHCDVSNYFRVREVADEIKERFGTVTILINNAAVMRGRNLLDTDEEEVKMILRINLYSSFITIKTFLPGMLEIGRGYIVTVASILGHLSPARLSKFDLTRRNISNELGAYGASKAGLISLHESLTSEIRHSYTPPNQPPTMVKTLLVCPGQIETDLFKGVKTPSSLFAPVLDPNFLAGKIVEMISEGKDGTLYLPFYTNFIPLMRAMPTRFTNFARHLSGMDQALNNFDPSRSIQYSSTSTTVEPSLGPQKAMVAESELSSNERHSIEVACV